jgi:hypothetical protein
MAGLKKLKRPDVKKLQELEIYITACGHLDVWVGVGGIFLCATFSCCRCEPGNRLDDELCGEPV